MAWSSSRTRCSIRPRVAGSTACCRRRIRRHRGAASSACRGLAGRRHDLRDGGPWRPEPGRDGGRCGRVDGRVLRANRCRRVGSGDRRLAVLLHEAADLSVQLSRHDRTDVRRLGVDGASPLRADSQNRCVRDDILLPGVAGFHADRDEGNHRASASSSATPGACSRWRCRGVLLLGFVANLWVDRGKRRVDSDGVRPLGGGSRGRLARGAFRRGRRRGADGVGDNAGRAESAAAVRGAHLLGACCQGPATSGVALSANIFGAMLGGFLEYNSMYWGYASLYPIGLALYGLAFVAYLRCGWSIDRIPGNRVASAPLIPGLLHYPRITDHSPLPEEPLPGLEPGTYALRKRRSTK